MTVQTGFHGRGIPIRFHLLRPILSLLILLLLPQLAVARQAAASPPAPIVRDTATARALHDAVAARRVEAMRWPDISDVRAELRGLYEANQWQWLLLDSLGGPTAATRALVQRLLALEAHGLDPADYDAEANDSLLAVLEREPQAGLTREQLATFDVRLAADVIRYLAAIRNGRVRLRWIDDTARATTGILTVRRAPMDVGDLVTAVRLSPEPGSALIVIEGRDEGYRRLQAALARYRKLAADSALASSLPPMPARLAPGQRYLGAPELRRLLQALGDLPDTLTPPPAAADTLYSGSLVSGIKRLQQREGLPVDGVIAKKTALQLQAPFATPLRALTMTLERRRALPDAPADSLWVRVNIPEFRMRVVAPDGSSAPVAMNVVVGGRGRNETPELASTLDMIVFSPTWRVPNRIMREEIVPKAMSDSMYLTRQGMELVRKGQVVPATPENLALVGDSIGVRQKPGNVNALGNVKFVFPNAYGVYLHDTPTKSTFQRSNRAESHGCVRLADAPSLARWLLRGDSSWTAERMKKAMASPTPVDVSLSAMSRVPVRLVYETAVVHADGRVDFVRDVYALDVAMELAVDLGYPYPPRQVPLVQKK